MSPLVLDMTGWLDHVYVLCMWCLTAVSYLIVIYCRCTSHTGSSDSLWTLLLKRVIAEASDGITGVRSRCGCCSIWLWELIRLFPSRLLWVCRNPSQSREGNSFLAKSPSNQTSLSTGFQSYSIRTFLIWPVWPRRYQKPVYGIGLLKNGTKAVFLGENRRLR